MVVLQRSELSRNRIIYVLTIILSVAAIVAAIAFYGTGSDTTRLVVAALALIGIITLVLSLIQLYAFPKRSHVLLVHLGDGMIIATNALHESFKLRFLRDILTDSVTAFSNEDRARWKFLEDDGYYPSLFIRNPKKVLILRLCTMLFDDVFAIDRSNRWEHHDSASTADPSFAKGEMPRLKAWKSI